MNDYINSNELKSKFAIPPEFEKIMTPISQLEKTEKQDIPSTTAQNVDTVSSENVSLFNVELVEKDKPESDINTVSSENVNSSNVEMANEVNEIEAELSKIEFPSLFIIGDFKNSYFENSAIVSLVKLCNTERDIKRNIVVLSKNIIDNTVIIDKLKKSDELIAKHLISFNVEIHKSWIKHFNGLDAYIILDAFQKNMNTLKDLKINVERLILSLNLYDPTTNNFGENGLNFQFRNS